MPMSTHYNVSLSKCVCLCVCASPSLAFFRNPAPRRFHCGHPSCKPADIRNTYLRRSPFIGCPSNHHSQVVKFRHRHCGFSKNSDSCDLSFWSLSDIWFCCGLLGWYVELLHSTSRLGSLKCFQSCLWANYWWKIHMVWYGDIYDDLVNMFMYFLGDKRVCNLRWHLRKHGCGSWIYCSFRSCWIHKVIRFASHWAEGNHTSKRLLSWARCCRIQIHKLCLRLKPCGGGVAMERIFDISN